MSSFSFFCMLKHYRLDNNNNLNILVVLVLALVLVVVVVEKEFVVVTIIIIIKDITNSVWMNEIYEDASKTINLIPIQSHVFIIIIII